MNQMATATTREPPGAAQVQALLAGAGIRVNGTAPHDIRIHDPAVYQRLLSDWSLGLGEAYMDAQWDCPRPDEFCHRLLRADLERQVRGQARWTLALAILRSRLVNLQAPQRAFQVAEQHYDIGNDVFSAMLDSQMTYSCGYWEHASDLEQAQAHKLDMICRKLELAPGERLLDVGCGWGSLAAWAARHYGADVVGITVSREQQALAQTRCRDLPVEIRLADYRELQGNFDKIASVGMFEHVGPRNYRTYFETLSRLLRDQGLVLLHTIGSHVTTARTEPWIQKYIFPNGKLPSAAEMTAALEDRFLLEDWHNFGPDYDRTLMAWLHNFDAAWPRLGSRYDERFRRMWRYYLCSCAGYFRSRKGQLWQLVLSKRGRGRSYRSWRPQSS